MCENQVNVEAESCNKVDDVDGTFDEVKHVRTGNKSKIIKNFTEIYFIKCKTSKTLIYHKLCGTKCTKFLPDKKFYREPGIANTLYIKECIMRIGSVLVQRPGRGVVGGLDRQIVDDGNTHIRMSFQTEC